MKFVQMQYEYHRTLEDKGSEKQLALIKKINDDIRKIIEDFESDPDTYHFLMHHEGDQNDYEQEYLL